VKNGRRKRCTQKRVGEKNVGASKSTRGRKKKDGDQRKECGWDEERKLNRNGDEAVYKTKVNNASVRIEVRVDKGEVWMVPYVKQ